MNIGYVYVVDFGVAVKVGKTTEPYARLKALREYKGQPQQQHFMSKTIEDYNKAETAMHRLLAEHRIDGEYFSLPFDEAVKLFHQQKFKVVKVTKAQRAREEKEMLDKIKYIREWKAPRKKK